MPQDKMPTGAMRGDIRSTDYTTGPDAHIQNRNAPYVQEGLKRAAKFRKDIATKGVTKGLRPGGRRS